jgi:hypothetical protein
MENLSNEEAPNGFDLTFETSEPEKGITLYTFKNLAVGINTKGDSYKDLPELFFEACDSTGGRRRVEKLQDVSNDDMEYVSRCIHEVARVTGIKQFWFYPHGEDVLNGEHARRQQARLRLFKRYGNIKPDSEGFGYIVTT